MKDRIIRAIKLQIRNAFTWAYSSNVMIDDRDFPIGQIAGMGKVQDNVVFAFPVGYNASPPVNTPGLRLNIGDSENAVFIPFSFRDRDQSLVEGEISIRNPITGALIKWKADGSIAIESKNDVLIDAVGDITINAPTTTSATDWTNTGTIENTGNVTINGNVTVNGTIDATGNITTTSDVSCDNLTATTEVSAGSVDLTTHIHSGVSSGPSNTGPPV